MKQLSIIALFLCASVCSFGQCTTSLFNTIAALEGKEPQSMTKKEFRQLAVKYASLVGESYDMTVKNARIAQKLCGLLAERQSVNTCLDLQPTSTQLQNDSFYLAYDSLQGFDSLVLVDVQQTIQAKEIQDTNQNTSVQQLEHIKQPTKYAPIKYVLQDLRKQGYSPTAARCEVKQRIEANNGLKFDFKLNTEVKATNLDRIKCDSKPKKINSSLKSKSSRNGGAKFKTKFSFKTKIRKLKSRINMVFGTCLK